MSIQIEPPTPGYRKWLWIAGACVVGLVVVLAAAKVVPAMIESARSCGAGVVRSGPDDECVGVTDGGKVFAPELADIEQRILNENRAVQDSGEPYVSVVHLSPMTPGETDEGIVTMSGIRHRLEGAHLAQLAANRTAIWGNTPKIKLLLANPGSDFGQWETAVEKIEARRAADGIVAVTGISFSVQNAVRAIERLSELQIPTVGSTLTADDLPILRGFLRVSPTAAEHARTAAEYLSTRSERILIVRDDSPIDHYGRTLAEAFGASFPDDPQRFAGPVEGYDSEIGSVANTFQFMMPNICQSAPDTIYFAGRATHALTFLTALAERRCRETPIRVVTGDDMAYYRLSESPARVALETGVSVLYTGLVHPQAWQDHQERFNMHSVAQFSPDCQGPICYREFSDDSLDDFAAVMEHDAVVTAVQAIRQAAGYDGTTVESDQVLQAMKRLHGAGAVRGASGILSFDQNGLPTDKPIPILEALDGAPPRYIGLQ
ncbi:hypothetical protein [Nocardia sp. NPDC024068]|uniref:hypothetical protein n=1 Tax=Nocardia sp. NPDC024068 TaxID=3157197 RepID=UPI0033DD236C